METVLGLLSLCEGNHRWIPVTRTVGVPLLLVLTNHDDVIKWKHFPRYWPFVREIHRSPVNSHTKASDAEL